MDAVYRMDRTAVIIFLCVGLLFTFSASAESLRVFDKTSVEQVKASKSSSETSIDQDLIVVPLRLNYQGYLTDDNGNAVSDTATMGFNIYTAASGGSQLWTSGNQIIAVEDGIFHYILADVPMSVFEAGQTRWLELSVRGQVLSPRTEITSVAWSYFATLADSAAGSVRIGGQDLSALDSRYINDGESAGNDLSGTYPNPTVIRLQTRPVSSSAPSTGQVLKWNGTQWVPANDTTGGPDSDWVISGSDMYSGVSGNIGIGTADPMTKFDVHGTICGGMNDTVYAIYGAVLGGYNNKAGDESTDTCAVVCGGHDNSATGDRSVVCGGRFNTASSDCATIAGGAWNTASGHYAAVGGGVSNAATSMNSTVAGGGDNDANDIFSTVGGGSENLASGDWTTVCGGWANTASGMYAFVGGGSGNIAGFQNSTVGGGHSNNTTRPYATVSGGLYNRASGDGATVAGGHSNQVAGTYSIIGGGYADSVRAPYSGIFCGRMNIAGDSDADTGAVICGGQDNETRNVYTYIGGGAGNVAEGAYAAVGGGRYNGAFGGFATVACGYGNFAHGSYAAVGGGLYNYASGGNATVAGGYADTSAGNYSFTAGNHSVVPSAYNNSTAFNGHAATASGQTRVGALAKTSGTFTIDHPLDPMNKILNHYFVESPEMVLIYRGIAVTGASGRAEVQLPDYYDALNENSQIQLTGVGTYEVYIAEKVRNNRFVIGGKPGTEVHWMVTGERKDPSAKITKIIMPVEQPKDGDLAGRSLDDDFLCSTRGQLERMGRAAEFKFRLATNRQRYEEMKRMITENR